MVKLLKFTLSTFLLRTLLNFVKRVPALKTQLHV